MPDDLRDNDDLRKLARALQELSVRLQRLERRVDELAHGRLDEYVENPGSAERFPKTKHSALESRIGSQWLNKIGVVAVLFGVAYLLRYAFVQQWISAAAWIWLGVVSGLAVIVFSEWFRRRGYRVLSLSLKATGIGVSYLSLWAGLELYRLLTGAETFAGFVSVTILGGVLAVRESAEVLAGLALVGGFLTPLLISIPSAELPLFCYLAILDCAMAAIILTRNWWKLPALAFFGTGVLSSIWYFNHYRRSEMSIAVVAATLFFAIFFTTTILERRRTPASSPALVSFIEIINPLCYFLAVYLVLDRFSHNAVAMAAIALSTLYFLLAWRTGRRLTFGAGGPLVLYGGLGIAFVALCLAVVLDLSWLSFGWFLEAAVIMAIGFWRDLPWMRWGSLVLLCASIIKAFVYDVWQLALAYRTLSFIGLGVLLLVISFAYQRYGFSLLSKSENDTSQLR